MGMTLDPFKSRIIIRFWETVHLPLPWANINTYFSLKQNVGLGDR